MQVSVSVGRAIVQHVLLPGVALGQLLVDTLLLPVRLELRLADNGVGSLQQGEYMGFIESA